MAESDGQVTGGASSGSTPGPETPGPVGIGRHLLFGVALLLAFGSMYAGVLGQGRVVQYALAIAGAVAALVALSMTRSNPQRPS
jgi:hypothetical protein